MNAWRMIGAVADLELRQRVRSTAWYVLLGVFALVLALVEALMLGAVGAVGPSGATSVFAIVVYLVLLLGCLVTPALSGAAVNGDRDAGTLATTQVTLVTTGQLLVGKLLAAWAAALAFLVVAVPFLLVAVLAGRVPVGVVAVALGVTAVELGIVSGIGVGLSSIVPRPIFSVVTTYLVVAALGIGTALAFGLAAVAVRTPITTTYISTADGSTDAHPVCTAPDVETSDTPRPDLVWWLLAPNPVVVLTDAVPVALDRAGDPQGLFTSAKLGIRSAQVAPVQDGLEDDCQPSRSRSADRTPAHVLATTAPSWAIGLLLQALLTALVLAGGYRALRTPARRLPRGSRVA